MPLVSEVLNAKAPAGRPPAREHEIRTACPSCGTTVKLHQATMDQSDPLETVYRCSDGGCDATVLIVSTPDVVPWEGRGYRLGDWMIRNPTDLFYRPLGTQSDVLIPASLHALD